MKIGDKYQFKNSRGEMETRTWIESVLDMQRYFDDNVYCPDTGFRLSKKDKYEDLWMSVPTREQRLLFDSINSILPEWEFLFQPEHYGNIIISRPGSHGNDLLEFMRYTDAIMPDEVLNDYIDGLDPITDQYDPQY